MQKMMRIKAKSFRLVHVKLQNGKKKVISVTLTVDGARWDGLSVLE